MTAFSGFAQNPGSIFMLALALLLLFLGIRKQFEPLLLVPIGFGVLIANFPGGGMDVATIDFILHEVLHIDFSELAAMTVEQKEDLMLTVPITSIAKKAGIMSFLYYALIKTGLLPPIIFMGVGALTDFGPCFATCDWHFLAQLRRLEFSPFCWLL